MRRICRHSLVLLAVFLLVLSGCSPRVQETLTLGEWLQTLQEQAGIQNSLQSRPYFLNIPETSPYFEAVQALTDYQVLEPGHALDPEETLNRDWTAATLINLSGLELSEKNTAIRDLGKSEFPRQVSTAVSSGLMSLNSQDCFCPDQAIEKAEALDCLSQIISYINTPEIPDEPAEITYQDDLDICTEEPLVLDAENLMAQYPADAGIQAGQYLQDPSTGSFYRAEEILPSEEGLEVRLSEADPQEILDTVHASGSFDVDFSQVEVEGLEDDALSVCPDAPLSWMAAGSSLKQGSVSLPAGYTLRWKITSAGLQMQVSKALPAGSKFIGLLALNSIHPSYQWDMEEGQIEHAYFRVDFSTIESVSLSSSHYRSRYGDFSQLPAKDFLSTVQKFFRREDEIAEVTVPICTLKIPIPDVPMLEITARLQLKLYASGKASLVLTQDHALGMEIRHGAMRQINAHSCRHNASIGASAGALAEVLFGLNMKNLKLADVGCQTGAKADMKSTLHLYAADGTHTTAAADLPASFLSDAAAGNGNVLVCSDLHAYWMLRVVLNSSRTLCGRLGLSQTLQVLDEENASLFPALDNHMENGHFVPHCTRGERAAPLPSATPLTTDAIRIEDYSIILSAGETESIVITGLPAGYSQADLVFVSSRPAVAAVDGSGRVQALQSGSSIIRISTADGKFTVSCNILVRTESST